LRARLHGAWPNLAMHFGLRETDLLDYSVASLLAYLDALADMKHEADKGG
jgi:hypothetical protein